MAKSPLLWLAIALVAILLMATVGPAEKSLGTNVRVVYLHGAWVWAALGGFVAAALLGLAGLALQREPIHRWSRAVGRAALVFWITYLPISLWAMQTNWNGLFLSEPRFRLAAIFAVTGILLQVGLWIINIDWVTSLANIIFIVVLRVVFSSASNVMHPPPSPIFNSGNYLIIGFFLALIILTLVAAFFLTLVFLNLGKEPDARPAPSPVQD